MAVLWFIVVLLIATVLHESGHFLVAKKNGVIALGFNIGLGPVLKSWKTKDTTIYLRLLPLGGYCEFKDGQLESLSPIKRILVFAAGPIVNFLLGLFFYQILYLCVVYYKMAPGANPGITVWIKSVLVAFPAYFKVGAEYIKLFFQSFLSMFLPSTPTFIEGGKMMNETFMRESTVVEVLADMAYIGFFSNFFLGFANIMPIPALDGGHIFLTLPALFGKPLNEKAYNVISYAFYIAIMAFSVLYIAKDVIVTIIHSS